MKKYFWFKCYQSCILRNFSCSVHAENFQRNMYDKVYVVFGFTTQQMFLKHIFVNNFGNCFFEKYKYRIIVSIRSMGAT